MSESASRRAYDVQAGRTCFWKVDNSAAVIVFRTTRMRSKLDLYVVYEHIAHRELIEERMIIISECCAPSKIIRIRVYLYMYIHSISH